MSRNIAYYLAGLATMVVVACGGGGGVAPHTTEQPPAPVQSAPKFDSLVIVGNSHTRADMNPAIGWNHDWGAIASAKENDYAHLLAAELDVPLSITSGIPNEQSPAAPLPVVSITPKTVAVIFLGDNGLPGRYSEIVAQMKGAAVLVCVSTWWVAYDRDDVMRTACTLAGGKFVYIGDVFHGRLGLYENEALDSHPGDGGHAEIFRRIHAAVKGASS